MLASGWLVTMDMLCSRWYDVLWCDRRMLRRFIRMCL